MAMNEPEYAPDAGDDGLLPCGRDLATLWDRWQQGPRGAADPHTTDCPHCAPALADLARLRDVVRRDGEETGTGRQADASRLAANIMDVVRLELRPGRTLALGDADEDAWIHEAVAARAFRAAAERVPGVRAGSCRVGPEPGREPGSGERPRTPARVRIEVTAGAARDLQRTADRIRRQIAEAARQDLGMRITSVDVVVTDLHHESPDEDPR
ncbi:Asp23/Gls24 family envelope stress response protein [Streptomyces sp. NPDC002044]|uniref:Asp23/Gls24 family envelope stress response protein n=1 Tax=Streptomyces sp. NPDC002044 TaxID=3154662 RepID=UPI003322B7FA